MTLGCLYNADGEKTLGPLITWYVVIGKPIVTSWKLSVTTGNQFESYRECSTKTLIPKIILFWSDILYG